LLKAKQKVDEVTHVGVTNSLIERVARVKDLAVGHVVVSQKLKKKKDKEKRIAMKRALGAGTGDAGDMTGDGPNDLSSPHLRASHHNSSGECHLKESGDSDEMLDEEERKA